MAPTLSMTGELLLPDGGSWTPTKCPPTVHRPPSTATPHCSRLPLPPSTYIFVSVCSILLWQLAPISAHVAGGPWLALYSNDLRALLKVTSLKNSPSPWVAWLGFILRTFLYIFFLFWYRENRTLEAFIIRPEWRPLSLPVPRDPWELHSNAISRKRANCCRNTYTYVRTYMVCDIPGQIPRLCYNILWFLKYAAWIFGPLNSSCKFCNQLK